MKGIFQEQAQKAFQETSSRYPLYLFSPEREKKDTAPIGVRE